MNDVFISYAHIDDQALTEGQKGWISQFHRTLEVRLGQLLGQEPRVWRDPKLQGSDVFDEALIQQFSESKVLVSVLTPRYVKSEWCRRELEEFMKVAGEAGGIRVQNKSRVFKVVKTPVPPDEMPPKLAELFSRLLGFEFYEVDSETGRLHEYDESFGPAAKQHYFERVYDLAQEICQVLKAYRPGATEDGTSQPTGRAVFLAETTTDLQPERDRLKRELLARGYEVLPDRPLPLVGSEFEAAVRELLKKCEFSVHLIGDHYGVIPEGTEHSLSDLQNRLAAEGAGASGLQRLIWMPKELHPRDQRQERFIKMLKENPEYHRCAEVIQDNLEDLKGVLLERLGRSRRGTSAVEGPAAGREGPRRIYVICDQKDQAAIEPVEDFFFDQGLEVSLPDFEADESAAGETHRQNLQDADGVLIFYGAARASWVDIKLRSLLKASGYGREAAVQAVYIAPPGDHRKERFRTHLAEIIRQEGGFNPVLLEGFVQRVKTSRSNSNG
jgi:hypothetical protein